MQRFTFDTLLPRGRSTNAGAQARYAQVVEAARRFADAPQGWFVLTGVPGSGKTHIAAAIANRAIERGTAALFLTVADLLDQLRASYADDAEVPYERLLEQIRTAPLVILDDLDAYADTPWAREKFYQVVSHRFHAALPTVFTCDRPPEEIDDRLGARLTDPALSQVFMLAQRERPLRAHRRHDPRAAGGVHVRHVPPRREIGARPRRLAGGCVPRGAHLGGSTGGLAGLLRPERSREDTPGRCDREPAAGAGR
jgi:hypothetical protein